jgi:hypothetical protein
MMSHKPHGRDEQQLRTRLAELQHLETGLTNKEALRTLQFEIAEIQWQLGEMTDEAFAEIEDFYLHFNFDF